MKIIKSGSSHRIYDDGMIVLDKLPAKPFLACYDEQSGPFLKDYDEIKVNEKVYGVSSEKVEKTLKSFQAFNRNLGVILSGDKGIGKSLFSKMLAIRAMESGYPLIVVNNWFPGIGQYLAGIDQEVLVLFDEFDKTFALGEHNDGAQTEMLTLFDGIAQGKKLFCITCNELGKLSNFLVNRPGRFHYHYRFDYPTAAEIREYLRDHLEEAYYEEIEKVVAFAHKVDLNYDCLRAIAFELNLGIDFETAILDLNILNMNGESFKVIVKFDNNATMQTRKRIDTFNNEEVFAWMQDDTADWGDVLSISFNTSDIVWDKDTCKNIVPGNKVKVTPDNCMKYDGYDEEVALVQKEMKEKYLDSKIERVELHRIYGKNLHYTV